MNWIDVTLYRYAKNTYQFIIFIFFRICLNNVVFSHFRIWVQDKFMVCFTTGSRKRIQQMYTQLNKLHSVGEPVQHGCTVMHSFSIESPFPAFDRDSHFGRHRRVNTRRQQLELSWPPLTAGLCYLAASTRTYHFIERSRCRRQSPVACRYRTRGFLSVASLCHCRFYPHQLVGWTICKSHIAASISAGNGKETRWKDSPKTIFATTYGRIWHTTQTRRNRNNLLG